MHFIQQLEKRLKEPLPGQQAQREMLVTSMEDGHFMIKEGARNAGVLSLFFPLHDEWHLVLIRRAYHEKDHHSRQISFPGGSFEAKDKDFQRTALRESEEEINVRQKEVKILGALTSIHIPVSNFNVFPYVGYIDRRPDFNPQAGEVEAVLEIPVSTLTDRKNKLRTTIDARGYRLSNVPVFQFGEDIVWGATAMMMNELVNILNY